MSEVKNHECDERTKAFFADKPSWYVCTLVQCEMCGLMYNPALDHVCPVDEKIRAAGSYIIQKHIGALKELAKGPEED